MSCQENDKIFEAALEMAQENGIEGPFSFGISLEDAYQFLITGELPCARQEEG